MEALHEALSRVSAAEVIKAVLSDPVSKGQDRRVNVRRIRLKGREVFQFERLTEKQAFHENVEEEQVLERLEAAMEAFRQMTVWTADNIYSFKITKKGKLLSNRQKHQEAQEVPKTHDRTKHHLLPEGTVIPPLVDLGVFTKDGKIVKTMYDKYRQIDRFVQMADEALEAAHLTNGPLRIVDFGCGKSYLTFILYYYLTEVRHLSVEMTGLDLKEDVIRHCAEVAARYGYDHLHFEVGDIARFSSDAPMDMVISLHACDTATDYALYNAVRWKSRLILSVPCCQHEVNHQLQADAFGSVTQYGILKERLSALVTDGLRADLLRAQGYQVQVLEFIDIEHSPKNILIRAHYTGVPNTEAAERVRALVQTLGIHPTLYTLMGETS